MMRRFSFRSHQGLISLSLFILFAATASYCGRYVAPTLSIEHVELDVHEEDGKLFYTYKDKPTEITECVPLAEADLSAETFDKLRQKGEPHELFVYEDTTKDGETTRSYSKIVGHRHWGLISLLPAVAAIVLCWTTREPIVSLFGGIIVGALLLAQYNFMEDVVIAHLATKDAASIIVLYLWLLGGLLGVWSRTGAAQAFADFMTKHFVRGPKTAKLVAWSLGIIFFQGGTVSTVLVGTSVKPIADKQRVSHEELAYIVDSTASPIASQLAFNAWPGYVQAFIFVASVPWLATESDRIIFFFKSVPFCFYAIFAVTFTFLLSIEKTPFIGRKMRDAIKRSRNTGRLDAPDAEPLAASDLQASHVPVGYTPQVAEFFVPLLVLIGIAIGTFVIFGSPKVHWAFFAALVLAMGWALVRGMSLRDLMDGFGDGLKGVVAGSVILLLAITIGAISQQTGSGIFLVESLGTRIPYWALPVCLQVMTIIIAFSTGTSWGTYAVAFPLAMPLAWAVAGGANGGDGLARPELFMTICFAAVMDGSVSGDQCSPISDTTVLSSMCTGCDLMDHVKTQLTQASMAAFLAAICWTAVTFLC